MKRAYIQQPWAPEQLPFIMSGKRYLALRFGGQLVLAITFAVRVRAGAPIVSATSVVGLVPVRNGIWHPTVGEASDG